METNLNSQDILNSIIKSNLNSEETIDLTDVNLDDILQQTQKLVNDAISNKTIDEIVPNKPTNEFDLRNKRNEESASGLKINTATETSEEEEDVIPSKYLSNTIDFVNYIEYQLPKEKTKIKKNTFILRKFENEQKPKFSVSDLNPQEDLSIFMKLGD